MKLKEIANIVHGELIGDPEAEISGAAGISDAAEGDITFLTDIKLLDQLLSSSASAVFIKENDTRLNKSCVLVKNPLLAFSKMITLFYVKPHEVRGVMEGAYISENVLLEKDISIYPGAYLAKGAVIKRGTIVHPGVYVGEGSLIGEDCILYPNVTIHDNVKIGSRVAIHSGTVIGSDGYGYIFDNGKHLKIPQVGGVIIEDDVEIGSNVSIDRATTGNTFIGAGTKIDNLVQIAHNVKIGKNSLIISQVGIAGSAELGDYVTLAGQAGVADHAVIDSGCIFGAKSGIMGRYNKGTYFGSPFAMPHKQYMRLQAYFNRLPELNKKINDLEKQVDLLLKNQSGVNND